MNEKRTKEEIKKIVYEVLILNPGIPVTRLMQETNLNYSLVNKILDELKQKNFISGITKQLKITYEGLKNYNEVMFKKHFIDVYNRLQK